MPLRDKMTSMARQPLPAIAAVVSFIDCINRGDLDGLTELMTDDHALVVLDEAPLVGRSQNRQAWHDYLTSFPDYVIYPRHIRSRALGCGARHHNWVASRPVGRRGDEARRRLARPGRRRTVATVACR